MTKTKQNRIKRYEKLLGTLRRVETTLRQMSIPDAGETVDYNLKLQEKVQAMITIEQADTVRQQTRELFS